MTLVESVYAMCILSAYVVRKAGRISLQEKIELLQIVGFIASNPDDGVSLRGGRLCIGGTSLQSEREQYMLPPSSTLSEP